MPTIRYVPRSNTHIADSLLFGRPNKVIRWKASDDMTDAELDQVQASRIQHLVAVQIRERVSSRYSTLEDYAVEADVKPARLDRLLRGEIVMRLEDIATAQRLLGVTL